MYPRNSASPEPIAIGAVVQISDGAVQTAGCTVRIKPIGVAEGDGGGTTAYSTDGIVLYTPTQAETNYTSFILVAKKTGCIPVSITVVTSASSVPGRTMPADGSVTAAVIATGAIDADAIAADAITDAKVASDVTIASVTGSVGSIATGGITTASFFAGATIPRVTLCDTTTTNTDMRGTDAAATAANLAIVTGYIDTEVAAIKAKTDNLPTDPADQSAIEAAITAATSPLATAANLATVAGYLDTEIALILADTSELQADWANGGRLDLILDARSSQTSVDDLPTNAELTAALASADDAVLAAVAAEAVKTLAIKAKTDNLPTDPADQSAVEAAITAATSPLATQVSVNTIDDLLDTEIAALTSQLGLVKDRVSYCLTVLVGACADAGTAAETYVYTIGGETFTADYTGLDTTGNRSTTTLSKV